MTATVPPPSASAMSSGRIEASARPTVAQYTTTPSSDRASAASAAVLSRSDAGGRNASATAIRIAARPALNRKNLTPASRDTRASVKTIPTPRCARKRKSTAERDIRSGGSGGSGGPGGSGGVVEWVLVCPDSTYMTYPTYLTYMTQRGRLFTSAQLITFHHAAR